MVNIIVFMVKLWIFGMSAVSFCRISNVMIIIFKYYDDLHSKYSPYEYLHLVFIFMFCRPSDSSRTIMTSWFLKLKVKTNNVWTKKSCGLSPTTKVLLFFSESWQMFPFYPYWYYMCVSECFVTLSHPKWMIIMKLYIFHPERMGRSGFEGEN